MMPVEWGRIRGGQPEDLRALDGDELVGQVYRNPYGPRTASGSGLLVHPCRSHRGRDGWPERDPAAVIGYPTALVRAGAAVVDLVAVANAGADPLQVMWIWPLPTDLKDEVLGNGETAGRGARRE